MEEEQNSNEEIHYVNPQKNKFWKLVFVFILLGAGFIALIVRLASLQIVNNEKYKKIARSQHESRVNLRAERGDIYDRNGNLLATTIKSYSFAIDPTILKDKDEILNICNLVSIAAGRDDPSKMFDKVIKTKGAFVWLARGLMPEQTKILDSIKSHGFIRIVEPKRIYLYGSVASQVIGCTDIDNKGLTGIELSYDSLLRGADRYVIMLRNAKGRLIPTPKTLMNHAVKGHSVQLTIDIELQGLAEFELKQGVLKSNAESGSVVIIHPETGEILAMASYPTFNPNYISEFKSKNMRNRVITDLYEPGSTFKLITAAAVLEEGIVMPSTVLDGHGGLVKYEDYIIRDEHKTGKVPFSRAMEISSNVIFSNLAYKLKPNVLFKYVRDFGFGLLYGISLPSESKGKIKKPAELDGVSRRFLGFGYGISVTSLQMVNAYSTVANDGIMMKPFIVKSILSASGSSVKSNRLVKIRKVVSKNTCDKLTEMLVGVVEKGTGKKAGISGLKIAGKTGTAQIFDSTYSKTYYTASFAGYLPAYNPQLTMLITLNRPKGNIYGGSTAAPIFRNIVKNCLSVSNSLSDNILSATGNKSEKKKYRYVPDFRGLDYLSAARILKKLDIKYEQYNNNFVIKSQSPPPGTIITSSNETVVKFTSKKTK